ncbi:MAG: glycosyltransferase [Planctomycetota bacterium]
MKIILVIHGYPMRYNAGSEVYTQTLAHALAASNEVHVFTREENSFDVDYAMREELDVDDSRVKLHIVNMPRSRDRYRHAGVDSRFANVLDAVNPDIVHIGHLNHLSTSILEETAKRGIPVAFTLHDYWLMCPRGQFVQMFPENASDPWAVCDGQMNEKCARRCYSRYFSGADADEEQDTAMWTDWVNRRMKHVREMTEHIDLFLAPSRYLLNRFQKEFGLPADKLRFFDYGFDRTRLTGRVRVTNEPFTFGYIGTHIPAKGIDLLLTAFGKLTGDYKLRIYGRDRGQETAALKLMASRLPGDAAGRIEWLPEYRNENIVSEVFNRVDAIVVPSIWVENSPLVIHEAQGARLPVVTADVGGMSEYVHHGVNGLLFRHRDSDDLACQMTLLASNEGAAQKLGQRGYIDDPNGAIPSIQDHAQRLQEMYADIVHSRAKSKIQSLPGPWRITFDTNPDDCNMSCIMCEEHSPFSPLQMQRRAQGKPPRRMPIELIRRVVADSAGRGLREIIPSTMGEPLLYAHFEDILAICREHGIKLNLTTNGTFPRLGVQKWAELIVPVTSDVKISWNGASKTVHESIMLGSQWEIVLENVREFIALRDEHLQTGGNRCRVTLQLTFLESNLAELPEIVRLAAELGVDRVKGHHLWAHFAEIKSLSMRRDANSIVRWNAAVRQAQQAAEKYRRPDGMKVLLENIFELDPNTSLEIVPGGVCPFLGQEAWVSAEGRFNPCCAPNAQRMTLGEFGNVNTTGIGEIWDGEPYRKLVAGYSSRSLCHTCNMRRPV